MTSSVHHNAHWNNLAQHAENNLYACTQSGVRECCWMQAAVQIEMRQEEGEEAGRGVPLPMAPGERDPRSTGWSRNALPIRAPRSRRKCWSASLN